MQKRRSGLKRGGAVGLAVFFVLLMTCPVSGRDHKNTAVLNIVTPEWQDITNRDGTGLYLELLRMVYAPAGIHLQYEFVPWARAVKYVSSTSRDAMLGSYNTVDAYFPNYPLDTEVTAAVYKKGRFKQWAGEKTLQNRTVVWVRGYNYHKYLQVNVNPIEVNKSEQGWQMLMADRSDFFLNSLNAVNRYALNNAVNLADFGVETVFVKNLYIRFAKTEKSKQFIQS